MGGSRASTRVLARGCPCLLLSSRLPEASLQPRWSSLGGETGSAHMMLAGVKTGPTHKVSVISQPQDRGLHMPSVSSSCSVGSSCPRSASLWVREGALEAASMGPHRPGAPEKTPASKEPAPSVYRAPPWPQRAQPQAGMGVGLLTSSPSALFSPVAHLHKGNGTHIYWVLTTGHTLCARHLS